MNNFTLTDHKEYLAGTLTKRPERVRLQQLVPSSQRTLQA